MGSKTLRLSGWELAIALIGSSRPVEIDLAGVCLADRPDDGSVVDCVESSSPVETLNPAERNRQASSIASLASG